MEQISEMILDQLKIEAGGLILVIGCGDGRFCRTLVRQGLRVIAIDEDKAVLAQAKALDEHALYRLMSSLELDYFDDSFEAVIIDRTQPTAALMWEAQRVLRPGAQLFYRAPHCPEQTICRPLSDSEFLIVWQKPML